MESKLTAADSKKIDDWLSNNQISDYLQLHRIPLQPEQYLTQIPRCECPEEKEIKQLEERKAKMEEEAKEAEDPVEAAEQMFSKLAQIGKRKSVSKGKGKTSTIS